MRVEWRATRLAGAIAFACSSAFAGHAAASAFAIIEQNASSQGSAHAGAAASAEDASTIFFNAAGLARLARPQAVAAIHLIRPSAKFRDEGSAPALAQPLGGNGGDAGQLAAVPNFYASMPLGERIVLGLGVSSPFGLENEYDPDWIGRYQAIRSRIRTVNVNPAVAFKVNDRVSIGAGVNYQRIDALLTNAVNVSGLLVGAARDRVPAAAVPLLASAVGGLDGRASIEGDDSAWGWNVGVLLDVSPSTRIGVAYRSTVEYDMKGSADFTVPAAPTLTGALAALNPLVAGVRGALVAGPLAGGPVALETTLPDTASLSLFHRASPKWDLLADVSWTGWSAIKDLNVVRANGIPVLQTPENFRDTWRFSIGATYTHSDTTRLRIGAAFDQSPVNDTDRTPRLPDNDRTWLTAGLQYRISPQLRLDAAATYIWVKDAPVNIAGNPPSVERNALLRGNYPGNIPMLSAQLTYEFR